MDNILLYDIVYCMKRNKTVLDQLRQAVERSGVSMNAISKHTGLPYAVVHGMMKSGKSITVVTLERIAAVLDLEIIIQSKPPERNKD